MKNKKIAPIVKFRIYAWKSKTLYFHVYIWPRLKDIRNKYDKYNDGGSYSLMAFVHPVVKVKYKDKTKTKYRTKPICGEIHLCVKELGMEIITHESTHATMTLLRRLKFDFSKLDINNSGNKYMNNEELVAYCVGHFAKQIVYRIYKFGILKEPTRN